MPRTRLSRISLIPTSVQSLQENPPEEVSREAAPEARGDGVGGGRHVPTFRHNWHQPVPIIEEVLVSDEESTPASSSTDARSQVQGAREVYRLEVTIDLTDSPTTTTSSNISSTSSSSNSQAVIPSAPASPVLHCPVCLESFSVIRNRNRGEH